MIKLITFTLAALIIVSCATTKKTPMATSTTTPSIIPGEVQLTAIKAKFPDATAQTLSEGYSIYTGACTNCHGQKNIFKRSEASWMHEIDDMSPKAKLTPAQKDALTKYILAMKATQPAESK
jgi:mono/diheme cytochrome c family protein